MLWVLLMVSAGQHSTSTVLSVAFGPYSRLLLSLMLVVPCCFGSWRDLLPAGTVWVCRFRLDFVHFI